MGIHIFTCDYIKIFKNPFKKKQQQFLRKAETLAEATSVVNI